MPPLLAAGLCPSELPMPLPVLDHRLAPAEGLDVDGIVCMDCRSRCCASASQVCRLRWLLEGRTSASEVARLQEDTSSCCHARDLTPVMENLSVPTTLFRVPAQRQPWAIVSPCCGCRLSPA